MNQDLYRETHDNGIGRALGIVFTTVELRRVVAELKLSANHFTQPDVVHGGVIMALGDCVGAYGAVLNLPAGKTTATIESKTNFLRRGKGGLLRAEALPIHIGQTLSVWRTSIFRGTNCIAEVTQTQIVLDEQQVDKPEASEVQERILSEARIGDRIVNQGRGFRTAVADERRRQIFEGACKVISEKGFAKATIREIAVAAEMPIPTMYQYLDRKEDLLYNIYEYFMTDLVDSLQKWRNSTAPAHDKLTALIKILISELDINHKYIKIMFQETRSLTPESRKRVYDLDKKYINIVKGVLDEAVEDGALKDINTELIANYIYFLCSVWPLRHWAIGKFGQDEVAKSIIEFMLGGIGATDFSVSAGRV